MARETACGGRSRRSRVTTGCRNCRGASFDLGEVAYLLDQFADSILSKLTVLHLKCDTRMSSCFRCQERKLPCSRPVNIRFRHASRSVDNQSIVFSKDQKWLRLPKTLRYHDETQEIIEWYKNECSVDGEGLDDDDGPSTQQFEHSTGIESVVGLNHDQHHPDQNYGDGGYSTAEQQKFYSHVFDNQGCQQSTGSPYRDSSTEPAYKFTEREAYLMRNFIENMAQWADVADLERHFEVEAPRRALQQPVLRLAILAFSSRHVSRFSSYEETEALQYYTQCLRLLIPVLSVPDTEVSEEVLAAVAILRQYEEMDDYDERCHLLGTTRILNSVAHFGFSGGLGEAAAWLCLREDIYASLVLQQPLRTRLENYLRSSTFQRHDDVSWANRMVFLLGKLLSYAFQPQSTSSDGEGVWRANLQELDREVEDWKRTRPLTFEPILFRPPSSNREGEQHRALPEVWMLAPFHAVGLQYYHIAKMVILAMSVSTRQFHSMTRMGPRYDCFQEVRKAEKSIRDHLLIVLGLAASNRKTAENTLFTARHALSVWGHCLRDKSNQDAAIAFLIDMEKATGWKTEHLINSLREEWWEEESGNDTSLLRP